MEHFLRLVMSGLAVPRHAVSSLNNKVIRTWKLFYQEHTQKNANIFSSWLVTLIIGMFVNKFLPQLFTN